ncbi:bifunctional diaminohydroxyphosphoribosylaminopyrimidine deaminase/5-amino-6-(5-phosphoribosylamino)uracil reductase RibD [Streptomyces uncialis]|uniref:bifunctional diaminohydroxyphosphoribosylaminopyrimidine deaminase/5-amino-6-(5-phosphoribosylamino)uracil reductase RibD n=1 Tax=Streptomyces uncialis TaxID=1048205 RepID=UPI0033D4B4D5
MPRPEELAAMRRAIVISASGLGTTSPNPPVGCVILNAAGRPVAEGYHLRKGTRHAEANALAAAGNQATGGTAVVTLEPCNHIGLTPPCHQALIDAGIVRVVIALMDPTSRGEGGAERLRQAGIHVEVPVLEEEALTVLGPWHASVTTHRPFLHLVLEADSTGQLTAPSSEAADEITRLRHSHDLVIDAHGTAEEGTSGSHGTGTFRVPAQPLPGNPAAALAELTGTGARTVLLTGPSELSKRLLSRRLADRLTLLHPVPEPSRTVGDVAAAMLPAGYLLSHVARTAAYLVVTAQPHH